MTIPATAVASPTCVRSFHGQGGMSESSGSAEKFRLIYIQEARNHILTLSVLVGQLSSLFLRQIPLDDRFFLSNGPAMSDEIQGAMAELLEGIIELASVLSVDLERAIWKKIELNGLKYPVELCKGKALKYTEYSDATGITKEKGQSIFREEDDADRVKGAADGQVDSSLSSPSSFVDMIATLTATIRQFSEDRNWSRFHLPRSLLLALLGELGELAEIFQFKPDLAEFELSCAEYDKICQEVADVTIYLLRLADVSGVSLHQTMIQRSSTGSA